ncbi:MAG: hypothetical protein ABGW97_12255 [Christiangramia sp.]|uniref:hypothetical protein n=1 Tax=Christiangramia sp. TaxID=1931228 RepID=UPI003242B5C6
MKISILRVLLCLSLLVSCSKDEPSDPENIPETESFELEEKIVGTWNVDNSETLASEGFEKQSADACYFYSFIFHADGTFIINYRGGTLTGNYTVKSEKQIDLGNAGELGNIRFTNESLSFSAQLTDICSKNIQSSPGNVHEVGECYSFLNCNDATVWQAEIDGTKVFIEFNDYDNGTWFRRYEIWNAYSCYSVENNQIHEGELVLIDNSPNRLSFIHSKTSGNVIYTYRIIDGELKEFVNGESTESRAYQPVERGELESLLTTECGEKTYVPDDQFEKYLISKGYDNVLDNYVLTNNIKNVTTLYIDDGFFAWDVPISLEGIEDFTALKNLQIWQVLIADIDLSNNSNLENLAMSSTESESLDLSSNTKLQSFYYERGKAKTIILPQSGSLKGFEITMTESIETMDISNQPNLEYAIIQSANLMQVQCDINTSLKDLEVNGSKLKKLDFSLFPNLERISLGYTNLEEYNWSALKELRELRVYNSENVSTFDLASNQKLEMIYISYSSLNSLDISANLNLNSMFLTRMDNLSCVKVDQVHLDRMQQQPLMWSSDDHISFSLNCD